MSSSMKTCNRPSPITESSFIVPRWIPWIGLALCVAVVVWVLGTCSDSPSLVSYAPPEPHIKGKTIKEENNAPPTEQRENRVTLEPTRLADGCWHVYLDVGSNIGVQNSANANRPSFKFLPPTELSHICAFGWGPNPSHTARLLALQEAYNRKGWKTKFFPETAVGVSDAENLTFYITNPKVLGTGSSIFHRNEKDKAVVVPSMDLSRFVLQEIVDRKLPQGNERVWGKPTIVMKVDIEGSEFKVIPHMLLQGSLCRIDHAFVEWHHRLFAEFREAYPDIASAVKNSTELVSLLKTVPELDKSCGIQIMKLDDESYKFDGKPFPE